MDKNAIVRLGLDLNRGVKTFEIEDKTFSESEAVEVLRQALIDANGGSTTFDYKSLRRNKVAIFEIIEELVSAIIQEGLDGSQFWNEYVDYKNLKLGDKNEFYTDGDTTFVVCEVAEGNSTPRRQRLGARKKVSVPTTVHMIRMYDHFARFMGGRIDWAQLCNKVAEAFQKEIWLDIATAFSGITSDNIIGNASTYLVTFSGGSGSFDEDDLIDLVAHVEAATGEKARIFGTKQTLKKITTAIVADSAKEDLYNQGYIGKFYGTEVFEIPQAHKPGTDTFAIDPNSNTLHVIAAGDKFIKFVTEGDTLIDDREYTQNADSTIEYRMTQKFGAAIMFASKGYGRYTLGT